MHQNRIKYCACMLETVLFTYMWQCFCSDGSHQPCTVFWPKYWMQENRHAASEVLSHTETCRQWRIKLKFYFSPICRSIRTLVFLCSLPKGSMNGLWSTNVNKILELFTKQIHCFVLGFSWKAFSIFCYMWHICEVGTADSCKMCIQNVSDLWHQ
jgi:hypothetical protein